MSISETAQALVGLCRQGKNLEAIDRLYDPQIHSVEAAAGPDMPAEMHGIDAVKAKNQWWLDNHQIHEAAVNGPYLGQDQFAVHFDFEVTFKPTGQRMKLSEMALYTVRDGKVVREQFFYNAP